MGLAERRQALQFQEQSFPALLAQIKALAGDATEITVAWDELTVDGKADQYAEAWPAIYFRPVIEALGVVGRDTLGREAIAAGLKKIEIRNQYNISRIEFENGVLMIEHGLVDVEEYQRRVDTITGLLEKNL